MQQVLSKYICFRYFMLARQHASSIFTFSTRSFSRRAAQGKPRGQAAQLASMSSAAHLAAAQGAVVGAFVGDASGAPLEFMPQPTLEQVNEALTMPGGGVWNVGPGQVTDDSEMALCLLRGLEQAAAPSLPEEAIARAYADWYITGPFDIGSRRTPQSPFPASTFRNRLANGCMGRVTRCCKRSGCAAGNTCSTACSAAAEATRSGSAVAAAMRSAAHEVGSVIFPLVAEVISSIQNVQTIPPLTTSVGAERACDRAQHVQGSMHSKANGALMRVTPLAVWGHALSDGQLADCARREAELTHPNITCQACWLIASMDMSISTCRTGCTSCATSFTDGQYLRRRMPVQLTA